MNEREFLKKVINDLEGTSLITFYDDNKEYIDRYSVSVRLLEDKILSGNDSSAIKNWVFKKSLDEVTLKGVKRLLEIESYDDLISICLKKPVLPDTFDVLLKMYRIKKIPLEEIIKFIKEKIDDSDKNTYIKALMDEVLLDDEPYDLHIKALYLMAKNFDMCILKAANRIKDSSCSNDHAKDKAYLLCKLAVDIIKPKLDEANGSRRFPHLIGEIALSLKSSGNFDQMERFTSNFMNNLEYVSCNTDSDGNRFSYLDGMVAEMIAIGDISELERLATNLSKQGLLKDTYIRKMEEKILGSNYDASAVLSFASKVKGTRLGLLYNYVDAKCSSSDKPDVLKKIRKLYSPDDLDILLDDGLARNYKEKNLFVEETFNLMCKDIKKYGEDLNLYINMLRSSEFKESFLRLDGLRRRREYYKNVRKREGK